MFFKSFFFVIVSSFEAPDVGKLACDPSEETKKLRSSSKKMIILKGMSQVKDGTERISTFK